MFYADSVGIERNLSERNLYTLAFAQGKRQYNLEGWFNRYESGYERAVAQIRELADGSHRAPPGLIAVLKLHWLSLMRNPFNHCHRRRHYLYRVYHHHEAANEAAFLATIRQRPDVEQNARNRRYQWRRGQYAHWLAALYGMMCNHDCAPSWFEEPCASLLATPQHVRLRLYRYNDGSCLLPDNGFVLQSNDTAVHIGFTPASDMVLYCSFSHPHWQRLPKIARRCHLPAPAVELVCETDRHDIRVHCNRLCCEQAVQAVYGQIRFAEDYVL